MMKTDCEENKKLSPQDQQFETLLDENVDTSIYPACILDQVRASDGRTVLAEAVCRQLSSKVQQLLKVGCNVEVASDFSNRPLRCGVANGDVDVVIALLKAGAHVSWLEYGEHSDFSICLTSEKNSIDAHFMVADLLIKHSQTDIWKTDYKPYFRRYSRLASDLRFINFCWIKALIRIL